MAARKRIAAVHVGGRFTYEVRVEPAYLEQLPLTLGTDSLGTALLLAELFNDGSLEPIPQERETRLHNRSPSDGRTRLRGR